MVCVFSEAPSSHFYSVLMYEALHQSEWVIGFSVTLLLWANKLWHMLISSPLLCIQHKPYSVWDMEWSLAQHQAVPMVLQCPSQSLSEFLPAEAVRVPKKHFNWNWAQFMQLRSTSDFKSFEGWRYSNLGFWFRPTSRLNPCLLTGDI